MSAELQALSDHIASSLGETVEDRAIAYDELTIVARREDIVRVATFLRDDPQCRFVCFIDLCGADIFVPRIEDHSHSSAPFFQA